ncbi:nucleotide sugar dehydrogenase [Noviherbaspirillum galbum]|uniref:Nucleotide sugar dehydrogenase n=1 Tax=Noviherbaspirillum galbum TaxID=2709383 RepID=A0A6B3STW3_9BURK|nr:nucleotide sugar dehydrogenase [Noviherbaspirillum galbum]NEX64041.1 nucleotide sugar dehydrogenase [Noviherbaspirillum galbum]
MQTLDPIESAPIVIEAVQSEPRALAALLDKLENRTAVIGIVGLGYVGLPLMLRYAYAGFHVIGFDIDDGKVDKINRGETYIEHISALSVGEIIGRGSEATTDFRRASEADALIICVPTPLNAYREPDLSFILNTVDALAPHLRPGQLVSLESTTYPGTTEEELLPRIRAQGLEVGSDVFLVFSPEREDPGNPKFKTRSIPKVVGGVTPHCQRAGIALYGAAIDRVVPVTSTRAAELTKLLENIYRAVNIGLVNEMKIIADRMGIDIHEVINAAATKPFGFTPYYPGPGLGGHCIPIDPFYLTWKARQYGLHTRFIELAGEINNDMPYWVVNKVASALNDRGRSIKHSRILVLGITYKKDVDDMRESPSVRLMELMRDRGAILSYSDPHVPVFPKMRDHHFEMESTPLTREVLEATDLVLLATNHSDVDYDFVQKHASIIVDTRGVYLTPHPNVIKS